MSAGPPLLFDRSALHRHRERAAGMPGDAFLLEEAAGGLAERLGAVNRRFQRGLDIEGRAKLGATAANWTSVTFTEHDALAVEPASFDLAVSALSLHAVNDLPGVLAQVRRALKPDGLFLAALLGGETLFELRDSFAAAEVETTGGISPRVAPFADVRDLGGLLQRAGFALPVADVERTTVLYRDFFDLVRDLRVHGETNALAQRSRKPLSRATLAALLAHYRARHAEPDGRLRATFDIVFLTGWAPHTSQQQPLKPGSATARLAEALGTSEHRLRRD
ncbi:MAG TPA: methyltransferase [Rhizomicrobium sp.]|nr:methyltransferase [Rhizomicrobium sp.]